MIAIVEGQLKPYVKSHRAGKHMPAMLILGVCGFRATVRKGCPEDLYGGTDVIQPYMRRIFCKQLC